ncbi:MAG: IS110 family transposase [Candidatus Falkowbacteria bacterium]
MKKEKTTKAFPIIYPNAAGIDISSKEHYVAVNPKNKEPIRSFGCFTENLKEIAMWLKQCKVNTVAMEATGIYWVSLFLILEQEGFDVVLVNAKHVKNVHGKKTDMSDAEWIRQLHSCGLLSASFQPDAFTRKLRTYMRHRKNLIEMAATHIRMMHKALEQMNIKLQHVITDITGKSGQDIIQAIILGEQNPEKLASFCDGRIRANKKEMIIKSLEGIWKEEHIFELEQSFSLYHFYQRKIKECDAQIEQHLRDKTGIPKDPNEKLKVQSNKNNINFQAKEILKQITGTDLPEIFGITESNALEIISEIGLNMKKWPTEKHFTSWLNLAPNNKISGGRILSSRIPKKKNIAGQVFKMAAFSVQRSENWLAMFFHRIKVKKGTAKAVVATARKIAVIFYKMMQDKVLFTPIPIEKYNEAFKDNQIKKLKRQAQRLGYLIIGE